MRKALVLSTALTLGVLNPVFAGGPVVVVTEAPPVMAEKPRPGGLLLPLLLLAVVVAVAAGGDDDEGEIVSPSDIRLKRDVARVGTNHLGLGVYQWRYDGLDGVWQGVMAHEVEVMHPSAVKALPLGYKAVNYAKLGLEMKRVA